MKATIILISLLALGTANAQTAATKSKKSGETATKLKDVAPKAKKDTQGKGDLDEEITNARMRAESGSKSKFSLSVSAGYSGGSIKKPLAVERPNLLGNAETETATELSGDASLRYRFDKNYSATFGAGFSVYTPLQGDVSREERQGDVSNPGLGFSRAGKIGPFQAISSIGYTYGTARSYRDIELNHMVDVGQNMLYTFERIPLTLGTAVAFITPIYGDKVGNLNRQTQFSAAVYPYAEYAFSDKYSLRTVFGYMNFWHRRTRDDATLFNMEKRPSYQSVGVGVSLTRDIYLYPNIQFLPTEMEAEKTNVALSATINVL